MESIRVQCLECGRRFRTRSDDPQCPSCGGVDVDVDYTATMFRGVGVVGGGERGSGSRRPGVRS